MKKIENQIRQQLENREIPVTENAWEKLSGMMENDKRLLSGAEAKSVKPLRPNYWWMYAAAASVLIFISVLVMNPFEKNETKGIQVVNTEKTVQENPVKGTEFIPDEISDEIANATEPESIHLENHKIKPELNPEKIEKSVIREKMEIAQNPAEKTEVVPSPEIKLDLPEIEAPQQIASNEVKDIKPENPPAGGQVKNARYVDAGMLLYSVENNQTISESKDNTKLVIIDFNK